MKRFFLLTLAAGTLGSSQVTAADKSPVVLMETSMGNIKIELNQEKAPITVKNFLAYVDEKFYDGLIFHRVMGKPYYREDFMIQGGGFAPGMKEKDTKPQIKNESANGLSNKRGTIAMARTPAPDSASSQFFINLKDNDLLDRANSGDGVGYCVFGKVIEGMEVVSKIGMVRTTTKGIHGNVPVEDVVIKSVRRVDK